LFLLSAGSGFVDALREDRMTRLGFTLVLVVAVLAMADTASAKEYPVGASQEKNGMEIGAVYLQPIEMDPPGVMRPAAESDVHLESDVKAAKDNKNGFAEGEWIPYLAVAYELTKLDDKQTQKGEFMRMVANDGPHYGDNVKMMGPGKYKLTLTIAPPDANEHAHFGRHVDKKPASLLGSRLSPSNLSSPMLE
jgi:periplasmic iron binding protein